jgi:E1A/CREB-binding protein
MGGNITIRQVTSMDRKLEVRERMRSRYGFKKYPSEFPFRCKCIVVFQNLDGVDVILFGLYVYEHGADSPPPNHRAVYISYLDSVHYMRPRKMRTFIYHEILISYLDYVRNKGFLTAHIWACPPLKGDDYILYAKPEDQKTPKDDRLRQWYIDMLIEAQKRDIVGKLTNMYDLYFADERNDATVVPYMDGDYFPAEVENVIKDIEEGKGSKSSDSGKKNKKKAKAKQKGNRGGTRSTGLDEDALKASGILPLGIDSKSLEEGARDFVMKKVGETIQPMKESFIVAFLNSTSPEKHTNNEPNAEEMQTDYKSQEKASDIKMLPSTTDAASSSSSTRAPLGCKPDQLSAEKGLNTDSTEQVNCEPILSHSNGVVAAPSLSIVKTENNIDSKGKILYTVSLVYFLHCSPFHCAVYLF